MEGRGSAEGLHPDKVTHPAILIFSLFFLVSVKEIYFNKGNLAF